MKLWFIKYVCVGLAGLTSMLLAESLKAQSIPAFEVASMSDSTIVYSRETLMGRTYLLDFWATWCGPCIAELPNLHEAYDDFQDDGFTILSLSFDKNPEAAVRYRKKQEWKMPWLHAFVDGGFKSKLAEKFGVDGIPKPILVGADGAILARGRELRGDALGVKLSEVFGSERATENDNEN